MTATTVKKVSNSNRPVTMGDLSQAFLENNKILIPLLGKMMDEKISENNKLIFAYIDQRIAENNKLIFAYIDQRIVKNNQLIFAYIDKILDKRFAENNEIIIDGVNQQIQKLLDYIDSDTGTQRGGCFRLSIV